ncbi:MAG TPA: hypothetical protein VGP48_10555 [Stellaceae bacterium]|nr:hypothetical protein [Stellaceae bacterium]
MPRSGLIGEAAIMEPGTARASIGGAGMLRRGIHANCQAATRAY